MYRINMLHYISISEFREIMARVIFFLTEKIFLEINQSETRIACACGGHVC